MNDPLDQIEARLRAGGQISYDDAADLFELTVTGRSHRIERARLLALLAERFPREADLTAAMAGWLATFDRVLQHPGPAR